MSFEQAMIMDEQELFGLLCLEKERRGVEENQQVFIGMADIADYYWCPMRSVLYNKYMESAYFESYLCDRVNYAHLLGYIEEIPASDEELLLVGEGIQKEDVEKLLSDKMARVGNEVVEHYPTIRWNFPIDDYVIVGVPDGITDEYVYECKRTASRFLLRNIKALALGQADLYGHFFVRGEKRVQIYIREEERAETWQLPVDHNEALNLVRLFDENYHKVKDGDLLEAPAKWKRKRCKFNGVCSLCE